MPAHPHQWVHYDGRWTCSACLTFAHSDTSQAKRSSEHCHGYCAKLADVLGSPQGHAFAAADKDGHPLIICLKCGGWAERNPVHLRVPCPGAPHKGGLQAFGRIARGLHPSYYGSQPPVHAVVPFIINEETALLIRSLRPHIRSSVPAPPTSANVNIQTLARIERIRNRGNQHGQEGSLHTTPQAATRAENDSQLERAPQATN